MVVVFQKGIVYSRSACTCYQCDEVSIEAWERMTYGGIRVFYGNPEYARSLFLEMGRMYWVPLDLR
jgi:hypothetical protein